MQSKILSWLEASTQTFIGFIQAIIMQQVLFPLYGWTPTLTQNFEIVLMFMVVSLGRAYLVRRIFNKIGLN